MMTEHTIIYHEDDDIYRCTACGMTQPAKSTFDIYACKPITDDL